VRIWSFDSADHPTVRGDVRVVRWPERLQPYLQGATRLSIRRHHTQEVVAETDVAFGTSDGRVRVVNTRRRPVVVTKRGRLALDFASTDGAVIDEYLDRVQEVVAVLQDECRLPAFLSYGSLLGAVREGGFIGHDVDADLGYLSAYEHPADVMRESFEIERVLLARGWRVRRENGGFIALWFRLSDGHVRNIDVFTCFRTEDRLVQVHDIDTDWKPDIILPLTTAPFAGRDLPVPANPEPLLVAAYGPSWRIPDPAFSFDTPRSTRRRINGWFEGVRTHRKAWNTFYRSEPTAGPGSPTAFAQWVVDQIHSDATVIDVGSGEGQDSIFFAQQGHRAFGLDYAGPVVSRSRTAARNAPLPDRVRFWQVNLYSLRDTLAAGASIAYRAPGPRVVFARLLLDALTESGRANFWSLCRLLLAGGGRAYVEFRTPRNRRLQQATDESRAPVGSIDPAEVVTEARAAGATVVTRVERVLPAGSSEDRRTDVSRLVLEWKPWSRE
jgi:hypothetical protein